MTADEPTPTPSRRDFLSGKALLSQMAAAGDALADRLAESGEREVPAAGETIRLGKRAMACEFDVILNPRAEPWYAPAAAALDLVDELEQQMSVYRPDSELTRLNQSAAAGPVAVEPRLFDLVSEACALAAATDGGFDPTAGPLIALWRRCREEARIPSESELAETCARVSWKLVELHAVDRTVRFARPGVELNLGSIGKGYALDRAAEVLAESGIPEFLLHGGRSSILGRGGHAGHAGWPIGLRNPLFPEKPFATILLQDRGMSTSGSGVQYFRHAGRRYGHLLDPRTGWPVEGMLSVTVLAPAAALADALSTAFFVIGVEKAREYCHNHPEVSALMIPAPEPGRSLQPINCGIPTDCLYFTPDERRP